MNPRRVTLALALYAALVPSAAAQDAPPALTQTTHLSTTGPGYVRVTLPQPLTLCCSEDNPWSASFSSKNPWVEEIILHSEFKAPNCGGCPPQAYSASVGPGGGSRSSNPMPPGPYRIYVITTTGKPVTATLKIHDLPPGEQSYTSTIPIPSAHAPLARRTVPSGRETYTATIEVPQRASTRYRWSWTDRVRDSAMIEDCLYLPGSSDPGRADAFDRGCPGATRKHTRSTATDPGGSAYTGFGSLTPGPFTYAMGVDRITGGGQLEGEIFSYSLDLPDEARGPDFNEVFGPRDRQGPSPSESPAPSGDERPPSAGAVQATATTVVAATRFALVPVRCGVTRACSGNARLGSGTPVAFSLAAGQTKRLRLPLTSLQRRTLGKGKRVSTTLVLYGKGVRDTKRSLTIRARRAG